MRCRRALSALIAFTILGGGAAASRVEHPPSPQARVVTTEAPQPRQVTTTAPPETTTSRMPTPSTTHPPPPTTAAPPSSSPPVAAGEVEALILRYFGPAHYDKALAVAKCESGLNPRAYYAGHAGIFQIAERWHRARVERMGYAWSDMYEAEPNIHVAHSIFTEQGWRPWTCA